MPIKFIKNNSKKTQNSSNGFWQDKKQTNVFRGKPFSAIRFHLNEYCRIWGTDNRRRVVDEIQMHPERTNIWCGVFGWEVWWVPVFLLNIPKKTLWLRTEIVTDNRLFPVLFGQHRPFVVLRASPAHHLSPNNRFPIWKIPRARRFNS